MESLIFCSGTIALFIVLFAFILLWRYLNYRETLALAEKGLVKPVKQHIGGNRRTTLVWGILITAIGAALTLGLWPLGFNSREASSFPFGFGPWMTAGFLPLFFGLALILIYVLTRGEKKEEAEENPDAHAAEAVEISEVKEE